jgi:23S rRNA pseudouridine2605 synthase
MPSNDHESARAATPRGVRLQRVMADAGVASRRDCETMIERGLVEVNGQVVNRLPVFVNPARDRIMVDGRPLRPRVRAGRGSAGGRGGGGDERVYVMLHKPDRVLCTTTDDTAQSQARGGARTTVTDLVQHRSGARIYPVGRLDYHSTGLVLMTNDGELADRLTHARYGVTRTYRVTVKGEVREDILDDLRRRVGKPAATDAAGEGGRGGEPDDFGVRVARTPTAESPNTVLEVTLREGRNRHLQAILEQMGCLVRKLTRVGIGPLRLRGVAVGEWRNLTREELDDLRAAGGLISPRRPVADKRAVRSSPGVGKPGPRRAGSGKSRRGHADQSGFRKRQGSRGQGGRR